MGAAHPAHRRGGAVLLVVGVQDEEHVHRAGERGVHLGVLAEHHPQEVRGEAQARVRRHRREALAVPVGHRGEGRSGGDQPADVERAALGVGDVLRVRVLGAQPGEERDEHRHRVRVRGEPVEHPGQRVGDGLEAGDPGPPTRTLAGGRQFAVQDQPGDVEVARALGELLDRVAAVAENALVAVNVGDPADAGGGVLERWVVGGEPRILGVRPHLPEPGGSHRAVFDVEAVVGPGATVGEGQRPLVEGAVSV